jgi:pentatricopeptide repeat protein
LKQLFYNTNQFTECIEFLRGTTRDEARKANGGNQIALVWKTLNSLAEKGNVEKVKEVFSVLHERGLTPINNVVLGPRVKAYLVK